MPEERPWMNFRLSFGGECTEARVCSTGMLMLVFATEGVSCIPSLIRVAEHSLLRGSLGGVITYSEPWFNSDWVMVLKLLASAARYDARLYYIFDSLSFIAEILKF